MSFVVTAVVTGVVATGYSIYAGEKAADQQEEALALQRQAQADAKEAAKKEAERADQEMNRRNAKRPDAGAILAQAQQEAKAGGGAGSTMLTGPMGVDPNALALGKNTLLGA